MCGCGLCLSFTEAKSGISAVEELIGCHVSYLLAVLNRCQVPEKAFAIIMTSSRKWEEYNKLMPTELLGFFPVTVRSALKGALRWLYIGSESEREGEIKTIRNELQKVTRVNMTWEIWQRFQKVLLEYMMPHDAIFQGTGVLARCILLPSQREMLQ